MNNGFALFVFMLWFGLGRLLAIVIGLAAIAIAYQVLKVAVPYLLGY